jgi:hypothetical protein
LSYIHTHVNEPGDDGARGHLDKVDIFEAEWLNKLTSVRFERILRVACVDFAELPRLTLDMIPTVDFGGFSQTKIF